MQTGTGNLEKIEDFHCFCCSKPLVSAFSARGQTAEQPVISLWPDGAPGATGDAPEDKPTLTIYKATGADRTSTGVLVFPGGGYVHLALDHEGKQIAQWLNNLGITAFVLQYRLGPKYHYPVELWDAQRAIRYVRAHASEFDIQPDRIGIWGFSAGGLLPLLPGRISTMAIRAAPIS